jgi:molybdopterin/thiamine biosynthesis adenylyltransferase
LKMAIREKLNSFKNSAGARKIELKVSEALRRLENSSVSEGHFDRQERISGWNQEKLCSAHAVILGAGTAGNYLAAGLSALGLGRISILDTSRELPKHEDFLSFLCSSSSKAESLEEAVENLIDKSVMVRIDSMCAGIRSLPGLGKIDFIIDASSSYASKEGSLAYCSKNMIPYISISADSERCLVSAAMPGSQYALDDRMLLFEGKRQGIIPSGIAAGLALDIARKFLMPLKNDVMPDEEILYTLGSPERIFYGDKIKMENHEAKGYSIEDRVLVAGAGAIGNFAALALSLSGFKNIDIADFDSVELANANRQVLICDRDSIRRGRRKAEALADRISRISGLNVSPIIGKVVDSEQELDSYERNNGIIAVTEDFVRSRSYRMIIGGVDNPYARSCLNRIAVSMQIPYFDAGTDECSGAVRAYIPGKSSCLECQVGIYGIAEEWKKRKAERDSCQLNDKAPSVVTSNMIAGSALAGEALSAAAGLFPSLSAVSYSSASRHPLFVSGIGTAPKQGCPCSARH